MKTPTLPWDSEARIETARATARGELRRELVEYWLQIAASAEAWRNARPSQLAGYFSKFAECVFKAKRREYARQFQSEPDYRLFLRAYLMGRVVDEITPLSTMEIMEQARAFQRGEDAPDHLPTCPARGEWERQIEETWTAARWRMSGAQPFREIDTHPFQSTLRTPLLRKRITAPIRRLLENQLGTSMAEFWELRGQTTQPEPDKQLATASAGTAGVPQSAAVPLPEKPTVALERRKPGPKVDRCTARRVNEIIKTTVGDGGNWKAVLDDICDALDKSSIPRPKTWRRRNITDWSDAAATEPELAKKAISHHLENAKK